MQVKMQFQFTKMQFALSCARLGSVRAANRPWTLKADAETRERRQARHVCSKPRLPTRQAPLGARHEKMDRFHAAPTELELIYWPKSINRSRLSALSLRYACRGASSVPAASQEFRPPLLPDH